MNLGDDEFGMGPQIEADKGESIGEGGLGFDVPGRGANGQGVIAEQL